MMRIALFEDGLAGQFAPLTLLRPVCELRCGQFTARERALRFLPVSDWGVFCRDHLTDVYAEAHPEAHLNELAWLAGGPTLLLNSRWLCDPRGLTGCDRDAVGLIDGEVAWITLDPLEMALFVAQDFPEAVTQLARTRRRVKASGRLIRDPGELVAHNAEQLEWDFAARPRPHTTRSRAHLPIIGDPRQVWIDDTADIDPYVVLDARRGPISIDAGAVVQAFTRIEGPASIGRQTQLFRANLRAGCTLGPHCRVGGELEASILHGYVLKEHDGSVGHAYVSPWCQLGALTTTSGVSLTDGGDRRRGCFLGDYVRTGNGCDLPAGASVGVMALVLPGGELLPRQIPSFTRLWHGELADGLPIEQSLITARTAMNRSGVELGDAQERLLRHVYHETLSDRRQAVERTPHRALAIVHAEEAQG
jgi:UDP-N-acetylglucosamine diphosphorylase / glucose-1-phosphate thymidylyltransferase / UDP-N-acetylgalactosamine diphosphorylase / glucosamine-1-phosphate N-acetyltransferase / galactosamine-1-phosphate N-acetyltransferase